MKKATYNGLLSLQSCGEAEDILFLSSLKDPLAEELQWMCGKNVTVRYWLTDKQATKEAANEDFIKQLVGDARVKFLTRYSEITGYLWTDEELNIGGHNLIDELKGSVGKWLILEVET